MTSSTRNWICFFITIGLIVGLSIYNKTEYRQEAKTYREAVSHDTEGYYRIYLNQFPTGKRIEDISDRVVRLANQVNPETISINVGSTYFNSINGIIKFQKYYDNIPYLYNELEKVIKSKVNVAYDLASKENTEAAWEHYKQLPSDYWKDADKKIKDIEYQKWGTDSRAWVTAQKINTIDAYNKYLSLFPTGAYVSSANKIIIDMTVNDIFSDAHGTLPSMDKTDYSTSSVSTITVSNDTQYTLTLLYSGADSKRLILSPKQTKSISLPNGSYRVAASVSASNVRSFAGTEYLNGGGYEVSYYISTSRF